MDTWTVGRRKISFCSCNATAELLLSEPSLDFSGCIIGTSLPTLWIRKCRLVTWASSDLTLQCAVLKEHFADSMDKALRTSYPNLSKIPERRTAFPPFSSFDHSTDSAFLEFSKPSTISGLKENKKLPANQLTET